LFFPFTVHSQSDPQAVALAAKARAALIGNVQVLDVTLTGTAKLTVGPDTDSGKVTLKALGTTDSRLDLTFSDGTRSEIRISTDGTPNGSWFGLDGSVHSMARHNQITDAAWFFPPLTVISESSNPNVQVNYIGSETKNDVAVQHIRFKTHFTGVSANVDSFLSSLSTTDVYLDATSFLPIAVCFDAHPNNDAYKNIAVEIDFSDYRPVNGVQVPFHIQKFFNGPLYLDLTIQKTVLNSGLSTSNFSAD
jgi:hypothetical protein